MSDMVSVPYRRAAIASVIVYTVACPSVCVSEASSDGIGSAVCVIGRRTIKLCF